MELPQVMMESDALATILAINQGNSGGILRAKAFFSSCSFANLKRDFNKVAHELAQFAKVNLCTQVWKGVTTPFVSHLVVSNLEPLSVSHASGSLL